VGWQVDEDEAPLPVGELTADAPDRTAGGDPT
jgi:hypothetical protein